MILNELVVFQCNPVFIWCHTCLNCSLDNPAFPLILSDRANPTPPRISPAIWELTHINRFKTNQGFCRMLILFWSLPSAIRPACIAGGLSPEDPDACEARAGHGCRPKFFAFRPENGPHFRPWNSLKFWPIGDMKEEDPRMLIRTTEPNHQKAGDDSRIFQVSWHSDTEMRQNTDTNDTN